MTSFVIRSTKLPKNIPRNFWREIHPKFSNWKRKATLRWTKRWINTKKKCQKTQSPLLTLHNLNTKRSKGEISITRVFCIEIHLYFIFTLRLCHKDGVVWKCIFMHATFAAMPQLFVYCRSKTQTDRRMYRSSCGRAGTNTILHYFYIWCQKSLMRI